MAQSPDFLVLAWKVSPGLTAPAHKPGGGHGSCFWKGTRGTSVVGIKTRDGTAEQNDRGASGFSVQVASGRYFQLICCYEQMILDGSALVVPSGTRPLLLIVLFFFGHSHLLFVFLCWSQMDVYMLGKGIREGFLLWRCSLQPAACFFVSCPLAERGGVLLEQSFHPSCIRSI